MVVTCGLSDGHPDMLQHIEDFENSLRHNSQNKITAFHIALPYTVFKVLNYPVSNCVLPS